MLKILILFCGGTIVQKANDDGVIDNVAKDEAVQMLLNLEPLLHDQYQLDVHYVDNIDSANMSPGHWDTIATAIADKYDQYDGFVVTHGTHSLAYTAGALSFALRDIGKPVVLTGAQIPGFVLESDARRNFINAVRMAAQNVAGVFAVFDEEIFDGTRFSKISESRLDAFEPINAPLAAEIRTELRLNDHVSARHDRPLQLQTGFCDQVAIVTVFPTMPAQYLENLIEGGVKGLIIQGYGPGDLPYAYLPVLELAQKKGVVVLVKSQCLQGVTALGVYDTGAQALAAGAIECHDMSLEAATTKLMWALQHYQFSEIPQVMGENLVGEASI